MSPSRGTGHRFGGEWTEEKLQILAEYLSAYTKALKHKHFRTGYIDAFAGTGYRTRSALAPKAHGAQLFKDAEVAERETQTWLDGSARIALSTSPRFDKYIFIERSRKRCDQLQTLKSQFPTLADDIDIRHGDANASLKEICNKNWSRNRAVLFLDPYGMQVEWTTIEAVAGTRAVDMFLLFPLGIGVNRLLTRNAAIPETWRHRLDILLGTTSWFDEFYRFEPDEDLFGLPVERVIKASTATIGRFFNDRLKSIFAAVAEEPRVLKNRVGCPLYLLCFAAGNPNGAKIAVRIANHLLTRQQQ